MTQTEDYFRERARRADRTETLRILDRAGKGKPPVKGDELLPRRQKGERKRRQTKTGAVRQW